MTSYECSRQCLTGYDCPLLDQRGWQTSDVGQAKHMSRRPVNVSYAQHVDNCRREELLTKSVEPKASLLTGMRVFCSDSIYRLYSLASVPLLRISRYCMIHLTLYVQPVAFAAASKQCSIRSLSFSTSAWSGCRTPPIENVNQLKIKRVASIS